MHKMILKIFFLAHFFVGAFVHAEKPQITLFTAAVDGTYQKMGKDLQLACNTLSIDVMPSEGSLQNVNSLIKDPVIELGYRFAFVQHDVLSVLPKTVQIVTVLPLFIEEVNIIANKQSQISTLHDLQNKKVSIGLQGSGNWITANIIKNSLGIRWINIERSTPESILEVLSGEIDAMILVSGTPNKMLADISGSMSKYIKLIPVEAIPAYSTSIINKNTYQWSDISIKTIATRAILISASDVPVKIQSRLIECMRANLPALRKFGHPKWQEVTIHKRTMK